MTLTIGPAISPRPKNVSSVAKVVPTELGNSFAMIAKLDVRNAAFPIASMILIRNARLINIVCPGTRSSNPNKIADVPVVKIPQLKRTYSHVKVSLLLSGIRFSKSLTFGPIRFKYCP